MSDAHGHGHERKPKVPDPQIPLTGPHGRPLFTEDPFGNIGFRASEMKGGSLKSAKKSIGEKLEAVGRFLASEHDLFKNEAKLVAKLGEAMKTLQEIGHSADAHAQATIALTAAENERILEDARSGKIDEKQAKQHLRKVEELHRKSLDNMSRLRRVTEGLVRDGAYKLGKLAGRPIRAVGEAIVQDAKSTPDSIARTAEKEAEEKEKETKDEEKAERKHLEKTTKHKERNQDRRALIQRSAWASENYFYRSTEKIAKDLQTTIEAADIPPKQKREARFALEQMLNGTGERLHRVTKEIQQALDEHKLIDGPAPLDPKKNNTLYPNKSDRPQTLEGFYDLMENVYLANIRQTTEQMTTKYGLSASDAALATEASLTVLESFPTDIVTFAAPGQSTIGPSADRITAKLATIRQEAADKAVADATTPATREARRDTKRVDKRERLALAEMDHYRQDIKDGVALHLPESSAAQDALGRLSTDVSLHDDIIRLAQRSYNEHLGSKRIDTRSFWINSGLESDLIFAERTRSMETLILFGVDPEQVDRLHPNDVKLLSELITRAAKDIDPEKIPTLLQAIQKEFFPGETITSLLLSYLKPKERARIDAIIARTKFELSLKEKPEQNQGGKRPANKDTVVEKNAIYQETLATLQATLEEEVITSLTNDLATADKQAGGTGKVSRITIDDDLKNALHINMLREHLKKYPPTKRKDGESDVKAAIPDTKKAKKQNHEQPSIITLDELNALPFMRSLVEAVGAPRTKERKTVQQKIKTVEEVNALKPTELDYIATNCNFVASPLDGTAEGRLAQRLIERKVIQITDIQHRVKNFYDARQAAVILDETALSFLLADEWSTVNSLVTARNTQAEKIANLLHDEDSHILRPDEIKKEFETIYAHEEKLLSYCDSVGILRFTDATKTVEDVLSETRKILEMRKDIYADNTKVVGLPLVETESEHDYKHLDFIALFSIALGPDGEPVDANDIPLVLLLREQIHTPEDLSLPSDTPGIQKFIDLRARLTHRQRTLPSYSRSLTAATAAPLTLEQKRRNVDEQIEKVDRVLQLFRHTLRAQIIEGCAEGNSDKYDTWSGIPEFDDWLNDIEAPSNTELAEYAAEAIVDEIRDELRHEINERNLFRTDWKTRRVPYAGKKRPAVRSPRTDGRLGPLAHNTSLERGQKPGADHHDPLAISLEGVRREAVVRLRMDLDTSIDARSRLSSFFTLLDTAIGRVVPGPNAPKEDPDKVVSRVQEALKNFLSMDVLPDSLRTIKSDIPKDIKKAIEKLQEELLELQPATKALEAIADFRRDHIARAGNAVSPTIARSLEYTLSREKARHDGTVALHEILTSDALPPSVTDLIAEHLASVTAGTESVPDAFNAIIMSDLVAAKPMVLERINTLARETTAAYPIEHLIATVRRESEQHIQEALRLVQEVKAHLTELHVSGDIAGLLTKVDDTTSKLVSTCGGKASWGRYVKTMTNSARTVGLPTIYSDLPIELQKAIKNISTLTAHDLRLSLYADRTVFLEPLQAQLAGSGLVQSKNIEHIIARASRAEYQLMLEENPELRGTKMSELQQAMMAELSEALDSHEMETVLRDLVAEAPVWSELRAIYADQFLADELQKIIEETEKKFGHAAHPPAHAGAGHAPTGGHHAPAGHGHADHDEHGHAEAKKPLDPRQQFILKRIQRLLHQPVIITPSAHQALKGLTEHPADAEERLTGLIASYQFDTRLNQLTLSGTNAVEIEVTMRNLLKEGAQNGHVSDLYRADNDTDAPWPGSDPGSDPWYIEIEHRLETERANIDRVRANRQQLINFFGATLVNSAPWSAEDIADLELRDVTNNTLNTAADVLQKYFSISDWTATASLPPETRHLASDFAHLERMTLKAAIAEYLTSDNAAVIQRIERTLHTARETGDARKYIGWVTGVQITSVDHKRMVTCQQLLNSYVGDNPTIGAGPRLLEECEILKGNFSGDHASLVICIQEFIDTNHRAPLIDLLETARETAPQRTYLNRILESPLLTDNKDRLLDSARLMSKHLGANPSDADVASIQQKTKQLLGPTGSLYRLVEYYCSSGHTGDRNRLDVVLRQIDYAQHIELEDEEELDKLTEQNIQQIKHWLATEGVRLGITVHINDDRLRSDLYSTAIGYAGAVDGKWKLSHPNPTKREVQSIGSLTGLVAKRSPADADMFGKNNEHILTLDDRQLDIVADAAYLLASPIGDKPENQLRRKLSLRAVIQHLETFKDQTFLIPGVNYETPLNALPPVPGIPTESRGLGDIDPAVLSTFDAGELLLYNTNIKRDNPIYFDSIPDFLMEKEVGAIRSLEQKMIAWRDDAKLHNVTTAHHVDMMIANLRLAVRAGMILVNDGNQYDLVTNALKHHHLAEWIDAIPKPSKADTNKRATEAAKTELIEELENSRGRIKNTIFIPTPDTAHLQKMYKGLRQELEHTINRKLSPTEVAAGGPAAVLAFDQEQTRAIILLNRFQEGIKRNYGERLKQLEDLRPLFPDEDSFTVEKNGFLDTTYYCWLQAGCADWLGTSATRPLPPDFHPADHKIHSPRKRRKKGSHPPAEDPLEISITDEDVPGEHAPDAHSHDDHGHAARPERPPMLPPPPIEVKPGKAKGPKKPPAGKSPKPPAPPAPPKPPKGKSGPGALGKLASTIATKNAKRLILAGAITMAGVTAKKAYDTFSTRPTAEQTTSDEPPRRPTTETSTTTSFDAGVNADAIIRPDAAIPTPDGGGNKDATANTERREQIVSSWPAETSPGNMSTAVFEAGIKHNERGLRQFYGANSPAEIRKRHNDAYIKARLEATDPKKSKVAEQLEDTRKVTNSFLPLFEADRQGFPVMQELRTIAANFNIPKNMFLGIIAYNLLEGGELDPYTFDAYSTNGPALEKIKGMMTKIDEERKIFGSLETALMRVNRSEKQLKDTDIAALAREAGKSNTEIENIQKALRNPGNMTPEMKGTIQNLGFDVGAIEYYQGKFGKTLTTLDVDPLAVLEMDHAGKELERFLQKNGVDL